MNGLERRLPKRWTEEEDKILYNEARGQRQIKDWNRIAAKLPGRTNKDCRKRWVNKVCGSLKKGAWEEDEDQRLRNAVCLHGQKWTVVANLVGLRSPDQCAKRWQYSLDPLLEHGGWTSEEDELLLTLVQNYGREWKFIQDQEFPTRSRNELKNRYTTLSRKLSLSSETKETTHSSSPSRPGPEETSPGADHSNLVTGTGEELQDYSSSGGLMQWEETPNDQAMSLDVWVDSIGRDWLNHLDPQISGCSTSAIFPTGTENGSPEAILAPDKVSQQQKKQRGAVTKASSEASEVMNTSSTSQWMGSAQFSDHSDFFHGDGASSGWANSDGSLLAVGQLRDDPMNLIGSSQESDDKSLMSSVGSATMARPGEQVGKVSLVVDQCDRGTLNYLLDVSRGLKGKAKLEIDT